MKNESKNESKSDYKGEIKNDSKFNNRREMPAMEDALGIERYAQGLARFIESAPTPLTIALQGDWGSGKTTLFNLMKKDIVDREKDAKTKTRFVELNTWQASVGGLGDCLSQVLAEKIAAELDDEHKEKVKSEFSVLNIGARLVGGAVGGYLEKKLGTQILASIIGEGAERVVAALGENDASTETDSEKETRSAYERVSLIKQTIADGVQKAVEGGEFSRLVVFVDDLDRLEPREAVTLLEGMKNFMDCEGCVFVLALDEEVVFAGVEEKYGKDTRIDYSRRFFDKIIQVPFSMPVASYDVEMYVRSLVDDANEEKVGLFTNVITHMWQDGTPGVTNNPRSIKRYLLLHSLYMQILNAEAKGKWGAVEESCLLGMLILRDRSKASYNRLCGHFHNEDAPEELSDQLKDDELIANMWEWVTEEEGRKEKFIVVAKLLAETLDEGETTTKSISACLADWKARDEFWKGFTAGRVNEALRKASIIKHPGGQDSGWATTDEGQRLGLVDSAFGEEKRPYVTVGEVAQQEGSEFQKRLRGLLEAKAK